MNPTSTSSVRESEAPGGFLDHPRAWLTGLWKRLEASRSLGLGAEMAFWLFLSLLPLAAVMGLVAASLLRATGARRTFPADSLPRATRELLFAELGRMSAWNGGQVGFWAGVVFIWLASSESIRSSMASRSRPRRRRVRGGKARTGHHGVPSIVDGGRAADGAWRGTRLACGASSEARRSRGRSRSSRASSGKSCASASGLSSRSR